LLGPGEVDVVADEGGVADWIELADNVDARVFRVDAHQDVLQVGPDETIRAAHEGIVFVGRIDPVWPMIVGRDRRRQTLREKDLAGGNIYAVKDAVFRAFRPR